MNQDAPTLNVVKIGSGETQIVWAHGWGMDNRAFAPLAQSFETLATSYLPDLYGHGQTPPPPENWGTRAYADAIAVWLATLPRPKKRIWIGHSFGCRVGLQLAAHHKNSIDALVLVGAAGLRRKRPLWQKMYYGLKIYVFKTLKLLVPEGPRRDALRARFGSADYKNAGALRGILTRVVSEDLSREAEQTTCPTLIICGSLDTETPPEISQRLHRKIKGSTLHILDSYDHYSILGAGRHQVAALIKRFMETR